MSIEHDPFIGKQLGTYQIQSSLGEGGMARVYKAYHARLRREVAIKVILSQVADREGFQARFEREAQVIASLEHPNIVSVYDFGEEGNLTYLVMQYVGGGTLRDQMRVGQPLEAQRAINYTIQMARALHHAHQRGIVHRDVKPQNMLVSSTDRNHLLLSDFGIAKFYRGDESLTAFSEMPTRTVGHDSSLTSIDQIIGTADYMAPEQVNGQPVDARTDVYALGIVLYQMLTGEAPFHSTTLRGLLFQHVYTPPPPVRIKNPLVPEILAQIVSKAMAKAPGDRFPTAEAMAQALEFANANAMNKPDGMARNNPNSIAYPPFGPHADATQQGFPGAGTFTPQRRQDNYATLPDPRTTPGQSGVTPPYGASRPTTNPALTGGSGTETGQTTHKRPLPLSYLVVAVVLILSLAVFGVHLYQSQSGSPSPSATSNSGPAQPFSENFQDNSRHWPSGSLDNGITASSPGSGAYTVTVPFNQATQTSQVAFPYPQTVGTLPDNFTLTATIKQTAGASNIFYGIAFRFTEASNGITSYALVANNSGNYQILEYKTPNVALSIYPGNYTASGQNTHTFKVKTVGNNYSFFVDGQPLPLVIGSHASTTTWSNSDLHDGLLSLFLSGPSLQSDSPVSYQASSVQLSIP
jgi:serine/threonine protein kinase